MVTGVTIVRGWFDYLLLSDSLINSDVLFSEGSPQLSLKLPPRGGCGTSCILNDHAVERGGMKVVKHFGGLIKVTVVVKMGISGEKPPMPRFFSSFKYFRPYISYDGFILLGIMVVTTKALFLGGSGIGYSWIFMMDDTGLRGWWLSIWFCNLDETRKAPQQGKGSLATEGINNVVFLYRFVTPKKTNMTLEDRPFEDVFPTEMGIFQCHVSFQGSIFTPLRKGNNYMTHLGKVFSLCFNGIHPNRLCIFFRVDPLGKPDVLAVFPEDVPPNIRFKGAGNGFFEGKFHGAWERNLKKKHKVHVHCLLDIISRWWQLKYFWNVHPELLGEDFHPFWGVYFSKGLVQPPTRFYLGRKGGW